MADRLRLKDAWAAVVLAEAAVSYAYSVAGPRLPQPELGTARSWYSAHEQARDVALLALTETGAPPVELPAFFALPGPVATAQQARDLLATVESRLATAYADLLSVVPPPQRQNSLDQVLLATERSLFWGAAPGPWGAAEPAAPANPDRQPP